MVEKYQGWGYNIKGNVAILLLHRMEKSSEMEMELAIDLNQILHGQDSGSDSPLML